MSEDARLSIVVEAKIDRLTEALSRANGQVSSFSARGQRAFDDLRAQVDPVGLAADRMAQKIGVADKALAAGKITATQHAQALALAGKAYADVKKAADDAAKGIQQVGGFNRAQIAELTHSGKAMFDMIAAGQSPLRATQVEAARLGQALSSGEGGLGGGLKSLAALAFTPIAGLVALGAALLALVGIEQKYEAQQRQTQTTLRGYGAASGVTASSFAAIADAAAKAGQGTVQFAEDAERAFIRAGATKDTLAPGVAALKDFAALAGLEAPEALKALAGAYSDPKKFADEFGGSLLNLTAAQVDHINQLVNMGEKEKATAELLRDVAAASRHASEELKTGLGRTIDGLADGFSGLINRLAELIYDLTHKLPAAARIAQLQREKVELDASPAGYGNLGGARRIAIDAELSRLGPQAERDRLAAQPATNAAAAAKRGREVKDMVDAANPYDKRIGDMRDRLKGLQGALNNAGTGGPSRTEIQAAIREQELLIKREEASRDRVPKGRKARQGPEDQTATLDSAAKQVIDRAQQDYIRSLLALTTDIQARAELEKQSVDAGLKKQLDALDAEEVKVRKSKNDAHKAEQIATIEAAKTKTREAAENQKTLIDQQAIVAAINEELQSRQRLQSLLEREVGLEASLALTAADRRTAEQRALVQNRITEDENLRKRRKAEDVGKTPDQLADLRGGRTLEDAATGRLRGLEDERLRRDTDGPLERWRDQSLRTAAQINEAYESVAARGLDALTNGITDAITGTKSLGDAFSEVTKGIIADLVRIAVQRSITQPLADALFPAGGGGLLSFLKLGAGHAAGGPVSPGSAYPVGERGTELFVPHAPGEIISNDVLRQLSRGIPTRTSEGAGSPVHLQVNVDAGGAFSFDHVSRAVEQGVRRAVGISSVAAPGRIQQFNMLGT